MKNLKPIIVFAFLIFSVLKTNAQFGQNGGFGQNQRGGQGQSGFDQISQGTRDNKPPEESEKSKKERLDKEVAKMKTELNLDELQVIVIQNTLSENQKKQILLFKKETPENEKIAELIALTESTDRKILEFLNKEQKIKYKDLTADRKAKLQELSDRQR